MLKAFIFLTIWLIACEEVQGAGLCNRVKNDDLYDIYETSPDGTVAITYNLAGTPGVDITLSLSGDLTTAFNMTGNSMTVANSAVLDRSVHPIKAGEDGFDIAGRFNCLETGETDVIAWDVNILVEYINKEDPVITSPDSTDQTEYTPVGSVIFKVERNETIEDFNQEDNEYRLQKSSEFFDINPNTGDITLLKNLNYQVDSSHTIDIELINTGINNIGGDLIRTTTQTFTVNVEDYDDLPPKFLPCDGDDVCSPLYTLKIPPKEANPPIDIKPNVINATDGDTGINADIVYSFVDGLPSDYADYFQIASATGVVSLKKAVNNSAIYTIAVKATQVDNPARFAVTYLQVDVSQEDNFPPTFSKPSYDGEIFDDGQDIIFVYERGTKNLLKLEATDDDLDAQIIYTTTSPYQISSEGYIFLNNAAAASRATTSTLKVQAVNINADSRSPFRTSDEIEVTVEVIEATTVQTTEGTTEADTTTVEETTTPDPTTTELPTTTVEETTTPDPTTTELPTTTIEETTTPEPTTTELPTTTVEETTMTEPTTTEPATTLKDESTAETTELTTTPDPTTTEMSTELTSTQVPTVETSTSSDVSTSLSSSAVPTTTSTVPDESTTTSSSTSTDPNTGTSSDITSSTPTDLTSEQTKKAPTVTSTATGTSTAFPTCNSKSTTESTENPTVITTDSTTSATQSTSNTAPTSTHTESTTATNTASDSTTLYLSNTASTLSSTASITSQSTKQTSPSSSTASHAITTMTPSTIPLISSQQTTGSSTESTKTTTPKTTSPGSFTSTKGPITDDPNIGITDASVGVDMVPASTLYGVAAGLSVALFIAILVIIYLLWRYVYSKRKDDKSILDEEETSESTHQNGAYVDIDETNDKDSDDLPPVTFGENGQVTDLDSVDGFVTNLDEDVNGETGSNAPLHDDDIDDNNQRYEEISFDDYGTAIDHEMPNEAAPEPPEEEEIAPKPGNAFEEQIARKALEISAAAAATAAIAKSVESTPSIVVERNHKVLPPEDVIEVKTIQETIEGSTKIVTLKGHGEDGENVKAVLKTIDTDMAIGAEVEKTRAKIAVFEELSELDHPNVIPYYGSYEQDGSICYATKFAENGSLEDKLKSADLDADTMMHIMSNVGKGLQYLHAKNITHGKLRAKTVMLDSENKPMLTDFENNSDIVKDFDDNMRWQALEVNDQVNGCTPASDVWSYGTLMWEIVSKGAVPYDNVSIFDLPTHMKNHQLPQPKACSDSLFSIMKTCWNQDPKMRPDMYVINGNLSEKLLEDSNELISLDVGNHVNNASLKDMTDDEDFPPPPSSDDNEMSYTAL